MMYLQVVKEVPTMAERLALFAAADVLLQTPLREVRTLFSCMRDVHDERIN